MNAAETAYTIMQAIPPDARQRLQITTLNAFTVMDNGQPGVLLTNCLIQTSPALRGSIRIIETDIDEYHLAFNDLGGRPAAKYPGVCLSDITDLTTAITTDGSGPGKVWRFLHQQLITNSRLAEATYPQPLSGLEQTATNTAPKPKVSGPEIAVGGIEK